MELLKIALVGALAGSGVSAVIIGLLRSALERSLQHFLDARLRRLEPSLEISRILLGNCVQAMEQMPVLIGNARRIVSDIVEVGQADESMVARLELSVGQLENELYRFTFLFDKEVYDSVHRYKERVREFLLKCRRRPASASEQMGDKESVASALQDINALRDQALVMNRFKASETVWRFG